MKFETTIGEMNAIEDALCFANNGACAGIPTKSQCALALLWRKGIANAYRIKSVKYAESYMLKGMSAKVIIEYFAEEKGND